MFTRVQGNSDTSNDANGFFPLKINVPLKRFTDVNYSQTLVLGANIKIMGWGGWGKGR